MRAFRVVLCLALAAAAPARSEHPAVVRLIQAADGVVARLAAAGTASAGRGETPAAAIAERVRRADRRCQERFVALAALLAIPPDAPAVRAAAARLGEAYARAAARAARGIDARAVDALERDAAALCETARGAEVEIEHGLAGMAEVLASEFRAGDIGPRSAAARHGALVDQPVHDNMEMYLRDAAVMRFYQDTFGLTPR